MVEPTLQQVFGNNATQSATSLTINKSDLVSVGLTANTNNTAESLFVGLLLLAKNYLTDANLTSNLDQSISIVDSFDSLTRRGTNQYRQKTYSVNLQKVDNGSTIDPDDY